MWFFSPKNPYPALKIRLIKFLKHGNENLTLEIERAQPKIVRYMLLIEPLLIFPIENDA